MNSIQGHIGTGSFYIGENSELIDYETGEMLILENGDTLIVE